MQRIQLVLTIVAIFITYSISEVVRLQNGQDSFAVDSVTGERLGGRRNKQSVASQMDELLLHEHMMKSNAKRQFLESKDQSYFGQILEFFKFLSWPPSLPTPSLAFWFQFPIGTHLEPNWNLEENKYNTNNIWYSKFD